MIESVFCIGKDNDCFLSFVTRSVVSGEGFRYEISENTE